MPKKVKQIAATVDERDVALFALCEDGSIYVNSFANVYCTWTRLPPIPDDEPSPQVEIDLAGGAAE